MGLFDFLKQKNNKNFENKQVESIPSQVKTFKYPAISQKQYNVKTNQPLSNLYRLLPNNENIAFFKNGILINVSPRNHSVPLAQDRQTAYSARYIVSDGVKYDLFSPEDIANIKIPSFDSKNEYSRYVVLNMAYILQMLAHKETSNLLGVPLIFKAVDLMMASSHIFSWTKKDFVVFMDSLNGMQEFEYAAMLDDFLKKYVPYYTDDYYFAKRNFLRCFSDCRKENNDLVEVGYTKGACPECAKYQNRIYSISGKDGRFPKLPDGVIANYGFHKDCSCVFSPCFYYPGRTIMKYSYDDEGNCVTSEADAIKYSNRSFNVKQSNSEIESYKKAVSKRKKEKVEALFPSEAINKMIIRREYEWMSLVMPEKTPKTLSAYSKMKTSNSKKYLEIMNTALEKGVIFSELQN